MTVKNLIEELQEIEDNKIIYDHVVSFNKQIS